MTIQSAVIATEFTSPIKLSEYLTSRRPRIATALSSVKEILVDRKNALIVEPGDVESLYVGIRRVLEDRVLTERLAIQASDDPGKYTWEERAKKYLIGYEDLKFVSFVGSFLLDLNPRFNIYH